jgi:transposase-like protein
MMEDYPKTLQELEKRFSTESGCRSYLFSLRWPNGFICPRCGHTKAWEMDHCIFWCTSCSYKASVTAGTIFDRTRKPLVDWFRVIWYITSQKYGASAKGLQRILGFGSYETAWTWLHKLRRSMVRHGRDRLTGEIEVDETFYGGEKHGGKRGRGASGKSLILIAAQKEGKKLGRIRLKRIPNASAETLTKGIQEAIEPGSVVRTDAWSGYSKLKDFGFKHEVVKISEDVDENLLPGCNLIASLMKRWLGGTLQGAVSHDHLEYYLDEYTFRFNRRKSQYRGKLFYRLLQQAVITDVTTYSSIKKGIRTQRDADHDL